VVIGLAEAPTSLTRKSPAALAAISAHLKHDHLFHGFYLFSHDNGHIVDGKNGFPLFGIVSGGRPRFTKWPVALA
jgi:hypothetical protein